MNTAGHDQRKQRDAGAAVARRRRLCCNARCSRCRFHSNRHIAAVNNGIKIGNRTKNVHKYRLSSGLFAVDFCLVMTTFGFFHVGYDPNSVAVEIVQVVGADRLVDLS